MGKTYHTIEDKRSAKLWRALRRIREVKTSREMDLEESRSVRKEEEVIRCSRK